MKITVRARHCTRQDVSPVDGILLQPAPDLGGVESLQNAFKV
jgi:hypothetical protein